jgi:hypothetical protein
MKTPSLLSRFTDRLFSGRMNAEIQRRVDLAVRAVDDSHDRSLSANTYPRDRYDYDRETVLADALEAWRVNPLARRIVELTSQYVVGGGLSIECSHEKTHQFIKDWWTHRLNRMDVRVFEWCDELSRSGELFIVLSTDDAGMSYLRAVPAFDIEEIHTADNDLEQETEIIEKADDTLQKRSWKAYSAQSDFKNEKGLFDTVMIHYAVNKPVGAKHGESDLAPMLKWLSRYAAWLEDRARLNRFRNTFIFWIKAKFNSAAERLTRQAELNANPPNPGSLLVTDETETWQVLSPKLESADAAEDGLAIKKMIAAGSGVPLHFLAEPESSTRTTAESAGGPTFRRFQQRQLYFLWMIEDLAKIAIRRRKSYDRMVNDKAPLRLSGYDISARDNAALAVAASTVTGSFLELRNRGLIDDAELLRIAYRFAAENVDVEGMLKRGKEAGPYTPPGQSSGTGDGTGGSGTRPDPGTPKPDKPSAGSSKDNPLRPSGVKIDPVTGDVKGAE